VNALVLILQAAWKSIIPERLSKLLTSMPNRLPVAEVIATEENATKY